MRSYTSAGIAVSDVVEVNVPVKNKLRSVRRWQRAVVRGVKGNKILIVELSETGAYAEVHRENARVLHSFSKENDRIVSVEQLNQDMGDDFDKSLSEKSKILEQKPALTTIEKDVVDSLVRRS